jgi:hypothetical protein
VPEQPDADHRRPDDADDATVRAAGRVGEYAEWVARARGRLYDFHQMMGRADAVLGDALELLTEAGHDDLAQSIRADLLGRNVVPDLWTFELVEQFEQTYGQVAGHWAARVREQLMAGRHHVHEAEMKAARRIDGPADDR